MTAPAQDAPYLVGVMMMEVEGKDSAAFNALVREAADRFAEEVSGETRLRTETLSFEGPHLTPGAGAYAPLDFLEIALAEKLERRIHFLLIVTEVDLSSSSLAYTLALPSQLTNVAILSTKRLHPGFWGETADAGRARDRLTTLLLHSFGHLLNLKAGGAPDNFMYPVEKVEDLDRMQRFDDAQLARMRRMLPKEARERATRVRKRRFVLKTLVRNAGAIARAVRCANPLRLLTRLPTMIAAALSVIIVLLFSAEVWDVASAVSTAQIALFSVASLAAALFVLYRAFAFDALLTRERLLTESTVVTAAATLLSLVLTLLILFAALGALMYLGIITVFPKPLMSAWTSTDPATSTLDHIKLSLFLAAMGVLAGSLGGRTDSRDLVRGVLFVTRET